MKYIPWPSTNCGIRYLCVCVPITNYDLFSNIHFDVLFYEKWYIFWVAMSNNFIHFFSKKRSAPALDIGIKVECSNNLCLKSRVLFCSMWSKKPDLCTYRSQAHKSWRPFLWRIAKKTCVKMLSWTKISFEKFYFLCDFIFGSALGNGWVPAYLHNPLSLDHFWATRPDSH